MLLRIHTPTSFIKNINNDNNVFEAKKAGYNAIAITDLDNMKSVPKFYDDCKREEIKPIIGLDVLMEDGFRIILIAKTYEGYLNLIKINSFAYLHHMKENKVFHSYQDLLKHKYGLIILLPMMESKIAHTLDNFEEAKKELNFFKDNFEEIYLEIRRDNEIEFSFSKKIIKFSNETNIPIVASSNIFIYRVYECEEDDKTLFNDTLYKKINEEIKPKEELENLFKDVPDAIKNANFIINEINFDICFNPYSEYNIFKNYSKSNQDKNNCLKKYPKFKFLREYAKKDDIDVKDDSEYFEYLSYKKLDEYLKFIPKEKHNYYEQRLKKELDFFKNTPTPSYMLIYWDIMNNIKPDFFAIRVGTQSLIAYLLGLTNIDPLKWNLFLEIGMLSEGIAYIDIYILEKDRQRIFKYLQDKYGIYNVACMEINYSFKSHNRCKEFMLARIIIDDNLLTYTPLYKKHQKDKVLIQYVNNVSFLPFSYFRCDEFKPLEIISLTLEKLEKKGIQIDLDSINLEDKKVFELICNGKTSGIEGLEISCFDEEDSCLSYYIQELKPKSFEELMVVVMFTFPSFYWNNKIKFIERRMYYQSEGIEKESIELVRDILMPTYGLILYSEQMIEIIIKIGDFNLLKADLLRRILGRRTLSRIQKYKEEFINNATKKGISLEVAEYLFNLLEKFAISNKRKAHILSITLLAYKMAYLKTYYPKEFMQSLIELSEDDIKKVYYLNEAKEMGILDFEIDLKIIYK